VSAADGPMPQTREHILLGAAGRRAGARRVLEQGGTGSTTPSCLELVELELRELAHALRLPGDEIPSSAARPSSLTTVEGPGKDEVHRRFAGAVDTYNPQARPRKGQTVPDGVEDVFSIEGRGTVATGRIERGLVKSRQCWLVGLAQEPRKPFARASKCSVKCGNR